MGGGGLWWTLMGEEGALIMCSDQGGEGGSDHVL